MPFVKLDCGILTSTLWPEQDARIMFITALLLAEPVELREETKTIKISSRDDDDFVVPLGWYGFVPAAGPGIARVAGIGWDVAMPALERLAGPDQESRSHDYEGRRMVRVDGGFIILNYDKYRNRDYTAAERVRRWRERKKNDELRRNSEQLRVTKRNVTQAEAEAEASKKTPKPPLGAGAVAIPENLKTDPFLKAWSVWLEDRKLRRKPVTRSAAERQLNRLAGYGPTKAIRAIDLAIEKGWTGIYDPDTQGSSGGAAQKPNPRNVGTYENKTDYAAEVRKRQEKQRLEWEMAEARDRDASGSEGA